MNILIPLLVFGALFTLSNKKSSKNINISKKYKVALFKSSGVSEASFDASYSLLSKNSKIELTIVTAEDIRKDKLLGQDVVLFGGGGGSIQGKDLKPFGIQKVREYVWNGGNYIGICGGAYLAMQGINDNTNKVAIVAGRNYGDYWKRGTKDANFLTNQNKPIQLHYENGPIFDMLNIKDIPPYQILATFVDDIYIKTQGTLPGETPGKPAIIISSFGNGKVLLFSPNPLLGGISAQHPELILNGIKWLVNHKTISQNLKFTDIFG